jgi:CRISPR-associated endonuclease/helicase Cas3
MMDANRLWAKSKRREDDPHLSMFLPGHLKDVYQSADRVLTATASDQLAALGLDSAAYRDRLRRIVLLAAAVHDLGKANDHFQGMVRGERRDIPQGIRHEWVTVLLLAQLREWLLPAVGRNEDDFAIVEWVVSGHHPAHNHASPPRSCPPGAGAEITFRTGENDFAQALGWLGRAFDRGTPPTIPNVTRNLVGADNIFAELAGWFRRSQQTWDRLKRTPDGRLVAAAKNALIAADMAGSVLPREEPNNPHLWDWITKSFAEKPRPEELQVVVDHRLNGGTPREFQNAVRDSSEPVTFVKAGCGTGKTLAAYMWAAKNHPIRRLYFCYPTTGTATEGFKDYLFEPDVNADLFHSRRDVDFEIILTTGRDTTASETVDRLASLDAWSTPIVACTVDTVLGLVQNNRRGLFAWPALAQSAFVFDEIHAYDDRLFGALLRFLRDLPGLPVLLMTASLPQPREEALRETLRKRNIELVPICGPEGLEKLPRYRKAAVANNDPLPLVQETLANGGKVLWVCNTVGRVMDAAQRAEALGLQPLIYHSRFKYEDRVRRHKDVVEAFDPKKKPGSALAICSQVAEMSLDLSADLLVTDLATVPALIQRLGRLNRRASKKGDATKPFIVTEPDNHLPYTPAELEAARQWLGKLPDANISQRDLAQKWEQSADNPPDQVLSAWLDGGPMTTVTELREASPGITVLMQEDRNTVREQPKTLARLVLPMPPPPRHLDWRAWLKERGLPIAPTGTIDYDPKRGAKWNA